MLKEQIRVIFITNPRNTSMQFYLEVKPKVIMLTFLFKTTYHWTPYCISRRVMFIRKSKDTHTCLVNLFT